jgi:hypothetical protein
MPSDEPHHPGECEILDRAIFHPSLIIHHLGFIRRTDAFWKKAKVVQPAFFNTYDERLVAAEEQGKQLHESDCEYIDKLEPFDGHQPKEVVQWMKERGRL